MRYALTVVSASLAFAESTIFSTPNSSKHLAERKALSALYAASFADKTDLRGYGGAPAQVLSYDGEYFLKVILPQHEVTYNEDLIENVRMGTVTVNLSEKEEG